MLRARDLLEASLVALEVGRSCPVDLLERGFDPLADEQELLVEVGSEREVGDRLRQMVLAQPGEELVDGRLRGSPDRPYLRREPRPLRELLRLAEVVGEAAPDRERKVEERLREGVPQTLAALPEQTGDVFERPDDRVDPLAHGGVVPDEIRGERDGAEVVHRVPLKVADRAEVEQRAFEEELEEEGVGPARGRERVRGDRRETGQKLIRPPDPPLGPGAGEVREPTVVLVEPQPYRVRRLQNEQMVDDGPLERVQLRGGGGAPHDRRASGTKAAQKLVGRRPRGRASSLDPRHPAGGAGPTREGSSADEALRESVRRGRGRRARFGDRPVRERRRDGGRSRWERGRGGLRRRRDRCLGERLFTRGGRFVRRRSLGLEGALLLPTEAAEKGHR